MSSNEDFIKFYIRNPRMVLYGLSDFSIQDKWVLTTLMGLCWDRYGMGLTLKQLEGPYKLSLREIAAITGVSHAALRTRGKKNTREGILDRWEKIGYLSIVEARPINETTGKPGQKQTYLYIHLERIWQDNIAFSEKWVMPNKHVDERTLSFEGVDDVDTSVDQGYTTNEGQGGDTGYTPVDAVGTPGDHGATNVDGGAKGVDSASSKSDLKDTRSFTSKEEETKSASSSLQIPVFISQVIRKYSIALGEQTEEIENNITMVAEWYRESPISQDNFRFYAEDLLNKTKQRFPDQQCKTLNARVFFFNSLQATIYRVYDREQEVVSQ